MAIKNLKLSSGLIFYSDLGTNYVCVKFTDTLDSYRIVTRSISTTRNCCGYATAESFFKRLIFELVYVNMLDFQQANGSALIQIYSNLI